MIKSSSKIFGFVLVVILLISWEVYARLGTQTIFFPPVSVVLATFIRNLVTPSFLSEVMATISRLSFGYLISAVVMIPLGILMGRSKFFHNLLEPIVEVLRPLPSAAVIPIAILFLGIDTRMKLFVIVFGASWPILINTIDGVRSIEPTYLQTAWLFGFQRLRLLRDIIFPASLPGIATGMRISLAIALILTVTVEMIVGSNGLGYYVLDAERSFHFPEMYSGVLMIGVLGYLVNLILVSIDQKALRWYRELKRIIR